MIVIPAKAGIQLLIMATGSLIGVGDDIMIVN